MTQSATPETEETQALKAGARALSAFFAARGTDVSYSVALEALSSSLGLKNWRTLRAKLQAPEAPAPAPKEFSDGVFSVDAIYTDNDQLYGDYSDGISAIHAAILVQMERLYDFGSITEVSILGVTDRRTDKMVLCPNYPHELNLVEPRKAIEVLCRLAKPHLGEPPQRGVQEAEEWDRNRLAIEFWEAVVHVPKGKGEKSKNAESVKLLNGIYYEMHEDLEDTDFPVPDTFFTDAAGVEHTVDVLDLLRRLLTLAKTSRDLTALQGPGEGGVFEILQVQELLEQEPARIQLAFDEVEVLLP